MKKFNLLFAGILLATGLNASVIHVPDDYPTIQEGINASIPGDTIMVAEGIYYETLDMKAGVALIGSGYENTIIDGQGVGNNSGSVVVGAANSIIEGFTVRNSQMGNLGAGIDAHYISLTIKDNYITNCRIAIRTFADPIIVGNQIIDNPGLAGLFLSFDCTAEVYNNTIKGNGRGISISNNALPDIRNNIVTDNYYGVINFAAHSVDIYYNDVYGNVEDYSGLPNMTGIDGNISADPLFVDPYANNFQLMSTSPCIDAGDPQLPPDPDNTVSDMGAFYFDQKSLITIPDDYLTIQEGIDAANNGDTVLVNQGVYYENITFRGKSIIVASNYLFEQDSAHILNTVIDGGQPSHPDSASVVYFVSGEDTNAVLHGFTLQHGSGTFPDSRGYRSGGGIYVENSEAMIIHNIIMNNEVNHSEAAYGGGIFAESNTENMLIMKHNTFKNNSVHNSGSADYAAGGGAAVSSPFLASHNIFRNNYAEGWSQGAAFFTANCTGELCENHFESNHANVTTSNGWGGAIAVISPGDGLRISKNTIVNNTCSGMTSAGGGIGVIVVEEKGDFYIEKNYLKGNKATFGGAICAKWASQATITNNIIQSNEAYYAGGGIFITNTGFNHHDMPDRYDIDVNPDDELNSKGAMSSVINNTIIENTSKIGGGIGSGLKVSSFLAFNNIIYNNEASDGGQAVYMQNITGTAYLYYNDLDITQIVGQWEGEGNMYCDPLFVDGMCHLDSLSPCLNNGLESVLLLGINYYAPLSDYDGNQRPDTICMYFDIGVYENMACYAVNISNLQDKTMDVEVFPNPAQSICNIKFTLLTPETVAVNLFDLRGSVVQNSIERNFNSGEHTLQLNVSHLPVGVYILRLVSGGVMYNYKILVGRQSY